MEADSSTRERPLDRTRTQDIELVGICHLYLGTPPPGLRGKVYNTVEKMMAAKTALVLSYLTFLGIFYVDWHVWVEIFSGFVRFGALPVVDGHQITWSELVKGPSASGGSSQSWISLCWRPLPLSPGAVEWATPAFPTMSAIKVGEWGQRVGAIASAIGGKKISLSHQGKVFEVTAKSKELWRGWRRVTIRDQLGIWLVGCLLGMGIPALLSLQFVAGRQVRGDSLAAMTAEGIVQQTGAPIFWFLTLLCGFLVLGPSQTGAVDTFVRRWTDLIWTASGRARSMGDEKVKYVYYSLMAAYALWGIVALTLIPDRMMIVKVVGVPMNFGLGFLPSIPWWSIVACFLGNCSPTGSCGCAWWPAGFSLSG